jgi:beta-glucosidase
MYVSHEAASVQAPIRSLAGVQRVFLQSGEKQPIKFVLDSAHMSLINDRGKRVVEPGEFVISVGGKQPGFSGRTDARTTGVLQKRLIVVGKIAQLSKR